MTWSDVCHRLLLGWERNQGNGTRAAVVVEEVRRGQRKERKVVSRGSSMAETHV